MKGIFVVFEGIDGAGKSTAMIRMAERLADAGFDVVTTRQPGGTIVAEQIRDICLAQKNANNPMCPRTEYLLMLAARHQLVDEVINPEINRGKIVLCDRHDWSSAAYQGFENEDLIRFASKTPNLTIWLNRDLGSALKSIDERSEANSKFETEMKLTSVYRKYVELAKTAAHPVMEVNSYNFNSEQYQRDFDIAFEVIRGMANK